MKLKRFNTWLVLIFVFVGVFAMVSNVNAEKVTVNAGKMFYVENVNTLNPADLSTGDEVQLITVSDVVVDDNIIIKSGTPVYGTVTKAQGEGALGKAGKLSISINSVEAVDGTVISLSGSKTLAGESKKTEAVGGGLFLCAPMLLMKGEGVALAAHTKLETRIAATYEINGIKK